MKLLVVLVMLAVAAMAVPPNFVVDKARFMDFMRKYNKKYDTKEETQKRFGIFQESLRRADAHQKLNPRAKFGVTKFSDLTPEEFKASYLTSRVKENFQKPPAKDFSKTVSLPKTVDCQPDPTNFDWNSCNVVTPVYDQGQCGSCWAFSATETIESYYAIAGYPLTELSMQQIVDCDTSGSDQGCNGGFPTGAYQYVESAGGLDSLQQYPYTAEDGSCQDNQQDAVATVTNYNSVNGEDGLYQQSSTSASSGGGPVSVCVDASSWQDYSGGVLTSCGDDVDHCVQLTGYAQYGQSGAYWIVRNSWGTDWGQNGYIWIAIGQDLCSIGDYATVVTAGPAN
jgi:cathepsin F